MFQTLHEISKNLIFVFVWKYVWKYVNINVSDIKKQNQTTNQKELTVKGTYISVITLNVNGLNAPTKRQRLTEWIQKQDPHICCLQETHLRPRDTYRLKLRGWKKIFHANVNQKKAGVAIVISDKMDFKIKNVMRDKVGHYIMIKESTQEEDITIINICVPNIGDLNT